MCFQSQRLQKIQERLGEDFNGEVEDTRRQDRTSGSCCHKFWSSTKEIFTLENLKLSFRSVLKKRDHGLRKIVILVMLIFGGHNILFGVDKLTNQVCTQIMNLNQAFYHSNLTIICDFSMSEMSSYGKTQMNSTRGGESSPP